MYETPYHQTYNTSSSLLKTRTHPKARSYLHFHYAFELIRVLKGDVSVILRNKEFTLHEGDCILILPYQLHDYNGGEGTLCWICNFSPSLVKSFYEKFSGVLSSDPVFRPSEAALHLLNKYLVEQFPSPSDISIMSTEQECSVKSALYLICTEYSANADAVEIGVEAEALAFDTLKYISENYKENISLQSAAAELGYTYHYVSRTFNKTIGYNFKTMLNHYRLQHAQSLLMEGRLPITQICFESGFQSQRSFNQVFEETYGVTPSEMRIRYRDGNTP